MQSDVFKAVFITFIRSLLPWQFCIQTRNRSAQITWSGNSRAAPDSFSRYLQSMYAAQGQEVYISYDDKDATGISSLEVGYWCHRNISDLQNSL